MQRWRNDRKFYRGRFANPGLAATMAR
jgi:hypothetical protein